MNCKTIFFIIKLLALQQVDDKSNPDLDANVVIIQNSNQIYIAFLHAGCRVADP
jgi:hypothetical protein